MCTAATYYSKDHYFGRNLDLEFSYHEEVTVMPRKYPLKFRKCGSMDSHYAIIGMAFVVDDYPLYYDACNEYGLGMAGLNFPDNAKYFPEKNDCDNVAPFEFIPWILSQCKSVDEAEKLLDHINLWDENFSQQLPLSPLHWMIADAKKSIVVEQTETGLHVYQNPVGVMTNNPTFDYHMMRLNDFINVSKEPGNNTFSDELQLQQYSRGMGGYGIPGDLSSSSRFIKVAFTRMNSISGESESESVSQFFHILASVEQQRGLVHLGDDKYEITIYSSCCNLDKGIYYYTTYDNHQITAVDMHKSDLDADELVRYELVKGEQIRWE